MRLLIAGGGTGGHLFPALAVARAVKAMDAACDILFVGTQHGIEARIMPGSEFPIRFIKARGMRGTGIINSIRGAFEVPMGMFQSLGVLRAFRPTVVLGVGGYASGPTLAAAVLMRIPTAIQEQNSVMGTTNRLLSGYVHRVFLSWEDTEPAPPAEKSLLTGNPVREDILGQTSAGIGDGRFHILVFGGSRGARSINLALTENLAALTPHKNTISVRHQTGEGVADHVRETYRQAGLQAEVTEFITDMGAAYRWADLVVCRSGASSLAEITALGKAALVVPYPYAIGDHQAKNAAVLASRGAVRVIRDQDLKNGALVREIRTLLEQPELLKSMAGNSKKLGRPFAARAIAAELAKIQRSRT